MGKQSLRPNKEDQEYCKEIISKLTEIEGLIRKSGDKVMSFREACAYLGYAPSYLYKLTYQKKIPYYKPTGKMIFFSKNELEEWIFKSSPHPCPLPKGEGEIQKDPGQVDLFEGKNEEERWIEFPLKSRRKKSESNNK